jgi:hypothetical protein
MRTSLSYGGKVARGTTCTTGKFRVVKHLLQLGMKRGRKRIRNEWHLEFFNSLAGKLMWTQRVGTLFGSHRRVLHGA